jgi:hypothetical protein|tara:strand:- start:473 stop:652 length:180 start_codon:yes stop_codon:yes gene_type:complete
MQKKIKTPLISEELINYLEQLFPDKCADLKDTEKEVFYKSGQRSVVNHLIEQFKIQGEN